MEWKDDSELFALVRKHLFSAIVGDVLDLHGQQNQFLPPQCRPLAPDMVVVGRAMPVLEADVFQMPSPPFGKMLKALDDLHEHEVYVAAGCAPRYALWGELMATAAMKRGAVGAVLAGYSRDTKVILELDFPTFSYGTYALDQRGRGMVLDYRVPIDINGVRINPGDILVGDIDGVVVIPQEYEADIFSMALEQARKEKTARTMLLDGARAQDVFTETGVL